MPQVKISPARVKSTSDGGVFEAIVATYDVDSYGDKIVPGAFAGTLADWAAKGDPIPVIWSHMSHDPEAHIGVVELAEERAEGLWVRGRLDLDAPKAAQAYRLLKGRRVTQFSFAYDVKAGAPGVHDGSPVFELHQLDLFEVGPCLIGVNQQTELLAVKAAGPLPPESWHRFGEQPTGPLITPSALLAWAAVKTLESTE